MMVIYSGLLTVAYFLTYNISCYTKYPGNSYLNRIYTTIRFLRKQHINVINNQWTKAQCIYKEVFHTTFLRSENQ